MTSLATIEDLARARGLNVLGAYHPGNEAWTRILLGPDEPGGFWAFDEPVVRTGDFSPRR
jgi:hypothetical protein